MDNFKIDDDMIGRVGEAIFQSYCDQNGIVYTPLCNLKERVDRHVDNSMFLAKFNFRKQSFLQYLPDEFIPEIESVTLSTRSDSPESSVFDFFAIDIKNSTPNRAKGSGAGSRYLKIPREAYHWAEIKTGEIHLSEQQERKILEYKLPVIIYNVLNPFSKAVSLVKINARQL